jgi:hypothetical protein
MGTPTLEAAVAQSLHLRVMHRTAGISTDLFRFEELGVELITPGFYRVFFRDMEIGEFNSEELRFRAARRVG